MPKTKTIRECLTILSGFVTKNIATYVANKESTSNLFAIVRYGSFCFGLPLT